MLVHAVHGNGQDPNAELEQYSYNLGYQPGSPGGIAYAITERSGGPISACQATSPHTSGQMTISAWTRPNTTRAATPRSPIRG